MKTIRLLFLMLAFTTVTFYSCSDSDPISNDTAAEPSTALRAALNALRNAADIGGNSPATSPFCFEFVYPVTFSLSNGTTVTASTYEGLIELISNESPALYVEGIVFPFQVIQSGATVTINNECEFTTLLEDCEISIYSEDLETTFCFDIIFPVTAVTPDGQDITVNSLPEFLNYLNSTGSCNEAEIVFPISVLYNNSTVVINNLYEFYEMTNNCYEGCICTQEYAPVCVETPAGTIQFGNLCYAICAGYSESDVVDCDGVEPPAGCSISGLSIATGDCNPAGGYALTVYFSHADTGSATEFEVRNDNGDLIGTYALTDLPVTFNYVIDPDSGNQLTVNIAGNPDCSATGQWVAPDCDGDDNPGTGPCLCTGVHEPVCVQTPAGIVEFDNICVAECAGFTAADLVDCE